MNRRAFLLTPLALSGAGSRPAQAEPSLEGAFQTAGSLKFEVIPAGSRRIVTLGSLSIELENPAPVLVRRSAPGGAVFECPEASFKVFAIQDDLPVC